MYRLSALAFLVLLAPVPAFADRYRDCNQFADLDRRVRACTEIIRRGKRESRGNRVAAYNNRGAAYGTKGKADLAISDFSRAIKLNPRFALSYRNRANAYLGKGDYDKAISDTSIAIRLQPRDAQSFVLRGNAYASKSEILAAASDYRTALSLDIADDLIAQHAPLAAGQFGECAAFASELARRYADRKRQELARRYWKMSARFHEAGAKESLMYFVAIQDQTAKDVKKMDARRLEKWWKKHSRRCVVR